MRHGLRTAIAVAVLAFAAKASAQQADMTFFVTSAGPGHGADLGGLDGADKHCQKLAAAVGGGNHTWRAYLSTQEANGKPAVNARDRVGPGPWRNAKGMMIANTVDELHSADREGRYGQRPGRYAKPARRVDRYAAGRQGTAGRRGQDLPQLDEQD
jgi:hypothetical protein